MLHLITGLPGAGKTLYALNYVRQSEEFKNRPIYYNGIPELKLDWHQWDDPEQWPTLPDGAVLVLDECQKTFRPRGNGSAVPGYVSALETHRHRGIDLVLITQHPMLLDLNVRRLVGRHLHVVRAFGMQKAVVHEWAQVKDNCDKQRADSIKHAFPYPRSTFGLYKSAEVHTHKRRIPARVWVLAVVPLVILAAGVGGWRWYQDFKGKGSPELAGSSPPTSSAAKPFSGYVDLRPPQSVRQDETPKPDTWLSDRQPRVPEFPHTAPAYDRVTTPAHAPIPVACIASAQRCQCFTQQATKMVEVSDSTCRQVVANGMFVDFERRDLSANGGTKVGGSDRPVNAREGASDAMVIALGGEGGPAAVDASGAPTGGTWTGNRSRSAPAAPSAKQTPASPQGGLGRGDRPS